MNPSSVLSGGTGNAAMSLDPETREHLRACMIEVLETAPKVLGRPFPAKLATADAILKSTERCIAMPIYLSFRILKFAQEHGRQAVDVA